LPSRNENELWSLGVFYDLSEIRKTEKIRIDFVANASHEMRTPLTVIKGYADLLKQNIENNLINLSDASSKKLLTTQLDLLKPVLKGTDQLSDLMSELLNLSKIEVVGGLLKSQINITTLMTNVMLEIESNLNLNSKVIKLDQQINFVYASEDALKQILRNLLINAIKYSGDASLIQITWQGAGNAVLLKVKDNGPGITIDHQDRIFERFYRVDKGRGREQGGFGLGLALVKHHMLNHQGSVKLVSNFNLGSEFICEFPNN
jgi:two-component system phosphate regulon sensor histidine kinase PhoR